MLGLGAYSSSTDDDSDADEAGQVEDHSDWEPEHVLKVSLARASNNNPQFPSIVLGEDQTKVVEFRAEGERNSRTIGQNCRDRAGALRPEEGRRHFRLRQRSIGEPHGP